MPLSNEAQYGVRPLSEAINNLPVTPTTIRESGLFLPEYMTTTNVEVESKDNELVLVQSVPRGTPGKPVAEKRGGKKIFQTVHLPKDDVVRADDVQNVRAFGTENTASAVNDKVNDKLASMKGDTEYTREHLQLGALQGKVLDADGTVIYDFNQEFGINRNVFDIKLSSDTTKAGSVLDKYLRSLMPNVAGDTFKGWVVFASPEWLEEFITHKSIMDLYARFEGKAKVYTDDNSNTDVLFRHRNVDFIEYNYQFGSEVDIKPGEALLAPVGTKKTLKEYFAPADMNATVNSKALPYYASREKLQHDKGWSLHTQSNCLPVALRPKALATLKMS